MEEKIYLQICEKAKDGLLLVFDTYDDRDRFIDATGFDGLGPEPSIILTPLKNGDELFDEGYITASLDYKRILDIEPTHDSETGALVYDISGIDQDGLLVGEETEDDEYSDDDDDYDYDDEEDGECW